MEVRDASTNAPAAQGATGSIKSGRFSSPLFPATPSEPLIMAAEGGPGVYDVRVQKQGYGDWARSGVLVLGGRCGVQQSVVLHAALDPSA